MEIFGNNLIVVGKEQGLEIRALATFVASKETTITMYAVPDVNNWLMLGEDYLKVFNASIFIPGPWTGRMDGLTTAIIREKQLKAPNLGQPEFKQDGIFKYISWALGKKTLSPRWIFNYAYSMAKANDLNFVEFLLQYGEQA